MACVRVKRRLNEGSSPSPAIIVKKFRLSPQSPGEKQVRTDLTKSVDNGESEYKAIFKFVGTVKSKDEIVDSHISKAVVNECRASASKCASGGDWRSPAKTARRKLNGKGRSGNVADIRRQKAKDDNKAVSTEARYRLISTLRGVDASTGSSNNGQGDHREGSSVFDEVVKGLYTLYDIEELPPQETPSIPRKNIAEQVTCNGVTMECSEETKENYVYDLYFMHDCNVEELESTQDLVCIEQFLYEVGNVGLIDSDLEGAEDDDDSNDESNWRNDYPEEDDDFEKDYDYYRDYGEDDLDEQLMEEFKAYSIDATYSELLECDADEEARQLYQDDLRLHGRTYADYKARLRSYVGNEETCDVVTDAKSSNAFKSLNED